MDITVVVAVIICVVDGITLGLNSAISVAAFDF